MVKKTWNSFMQDFRQYFICIATVKWLQFFNFISNQPVFNKLYSTAFFKSTREGYAFRGNFVNGKEYFKILSYKFSVITPFALLQSNFFNFLHSIQIILFFTNFTQMPSLNWHEKVTRFTEFSANGKKTTWKSFLLVFSQCYICIATVKLLQFLTFTSDPSVPNKFLFNCLL